MTDKLKIYVVSILAMSPLQNADHLGITTWIENLPGIVPAHSEAEALKSARQQALAKWPEAAGWHSHAGTVLEVTREVFDLADGARLAGVVDLGAAHNP